MLTAETRARDFPGLDKQSYLNTAAESIPPACVGEALQDYWRDKLHGMKGRDAHFARLEECREIAARMIHRRPSEVSFCSSSAEAYNLLATALKLQPRHEVVVNDLDFPSGATPWLSRDCKVKVWKSRDGALLVEDLLPLLNERTRLAQTSLVSFVNGHRLDWAAFRNAVRSRAPRALISVDVTQALGRVVLDCQDADCLISSTHKWVLGIHGGCIVGIPRKRAEQLTTRAGGWFHLLNAFEADRFERVAPKPGAPSFSVGMPNFAAIYALNAALRYVNAVGVGNIARHADPLVAQLQQGLCELRVRPMTPPQRGGSGIVAFVHPQNAAIHAALERANIHVMHHAGRLRISLHGYNTVYDVERFLKTLKLFLNPTVAAGVRRRITLVPHPSASSRRRRRKVLRSR
ncbi:MAG: aminotransferase class V-fold PLP-dependent enzyme [Verrucomicrobia bacterium]|nr:aminotransferase class V-fold PLP-dependent enzyme [Verrucomicrobiota bacterium]